MILVYASKNSNVVQPRRVPGRMDIFDDRARPALWAKALLGFAEKLVQEFYTFRVSCIGLVSRRDREAVHSIDLEVRTRFPSTTLYSLRTPCMMDQCPISVACSHDAGTS